MFISKIKRFIYSEFKKKFAILIKIVKLKNIKEFLNYKSYDNFTKILIIL